MGEGTQIRIMDRSYISNPAFIEVAEHIAEKYHIRYQEAVRRGGGTNAGGSSGSGTTGGTTGSGSSSGKPGSQNPNTGAPDVIGVVSAAAVVSLAAAAAVALKKRK